MIKNITEMIAGKLGPGISIHSALYDAQAQLAYLVKIKTIDFVLTNDLNAFGFEGNKVVTSIDEAAKSFTTAETFDILEVTLALRYVFIHRD